MLPPGTRVYVTRGVLLGPGRVERVCGAGYVVLVDGTDTLQWVEAGWVEPVRLVREG